MFKPENWLDRVFEIGIIGKGLNGAAELIGGLLLLFLTPARIHHVVAAVTQGELSEDSGDFVATHLLHTANGLTGNALLFGSIYLLAHGVIKVALVTALLLNKISAYPWMIGVLFVFIGYQLYRISLDPTAGLIALTVFDLIIVALTWREYGQQRLRRGNPGVQSVSDHLAPPQTDAASSTQPSDGGNHRPSHHPVTRGRCVNMPGSSSRSPGRPVVPRHRRLFRSAGHRGGPWRGSV